MSKSLAGSIVGLAIALVAWGTPALGANIAFEFNMDGVLPSSQGATYFSSTSTPEGAAYTVSDGLLHQDLTALGADMRADYFVPNIYDPTLDATLEWRVQVFNSLQDVNMRLQDGQMHAWWVLLTATGVAIGNPGVFQPVVVPLDTTDALHTYRLVIPANSLDFDLYVDDVLRFSGTAEFSSNDNFFEWGNISGFPGRADWDYLRFTNAATAVPEPATGLLLGVGLVVGAIWRQRYRNVAITRREGMAG